MARPWLLGLLATVSLAAGDDVGLVRVGDPWHYLKVTSADASLAPQWRGPDFEVDAGRWKGGPGGFSFGGSTVEATGLYEFGNPARTALLRCDFDLAAPATVTWLILRADWSGGFVAWLNGVEFLRRDLPGDAGAPVDFDFLPEPRSRAGAVEIDVTAARSLLLAGRNTLAIQWHDSSAGGSASGLVVELLANFARGPTLQAAGPGRQTIVWRTPFPTTSRIEYGLTADLGSSVPAIETTAGHAAEITGLPPGAPCFYRVVCEREGETARSPVFSFRSLKANGPITFMLTADVGSGRVEQYAIARVLRDEAPDLVLMAGDLVYPGFTPARADFRWFSVYARQLLSTPFLVVAGNHDVLYGGANGFYDEFRMPANSVPAADHAAAGTGPQHYYSFDHGDAHFVGLYVPLMSGLFGLKPGSSQLAWLESDLAATDKPWKIVFLHHPLLSSGPHRYDDLDFNGVHDVLDLTRVLLPVLEAHGVQLVFSGHDHLYERLVPVRGVQCVISGGGGGTPYGSGTREPAGNRLWSRHHCVHVAIDGDSLTLRALDREGREFDRFHLQRTPLTGPVDRVTRHAPLIQPVGPPDGDGNFAGQKFDFAGEGLAGVAGAFASPGRLRVNVDSRNLYVGVEELALPEGDDLLLFLGVPGGDGVAVLDGLDSGDGPLSLGRLANLGFAPGFRPAVGCVLGDEFADATDRRFERPYRTVLAVPDDANLRLTEPASTGQGIFRLAPGFPEVPGTMLQQYNRSPQSEPVLIEQSANFIELAIPLRELGLTGESRLQIAGIVARCDPPATTPGGAGWLDRAWFGPRLDGGGFASTVLHAWEFQLPPLPLSLEARWIAEGAIELRWRAVPGRSYQLERAVDPEGGFQPVTTPDWPRVAATEDETWRLTPAPESGPARFFRLRELR
ncbi:MAG: metallophosphoesterase family protein [Verrucomicrobiales bacterium]|nr:metallophosphoesterase family protein [Verrucomicrobiales bacterium]